MSNMRKLMESVKPLFEAQLGGRPVVDLEVENVDTRDYPDFVDAFIAHAVWGDTGIALTDRELEALDPNGELAHELAHESLH